MAKKTFFNLLMLLSALILFISGCSGEASFQTEKVVVNKIEEGCLTAEELDQELMAYYDFMLNEGYITNEKKQELLDDMENYMDFGVNAYSVTYDTSEIRSRGWYGQESGLIAVPSCKKSFTSLPIISIQHPTIFDRSYSPSKYKKYDYISIPFFDLTNGEYHKWNNVKEWLNRGYIVVMADYPGLGNDYDNIHTFCHAESLGKSVKDMIEKAILFINRVNISEENHVTWNGQLFLAGHSEGGYATLAAGKYIQENPGVFGLNVNGLAAMSGPYDLSGEMRSIITDDEDDYPELEYLPYIIYGYNEIYINDKKETLYNFFNNTSEVFKENEFGENYGDLFEKVLKSSDDGGKTDRIKNIFKGLKKPSDIFTEQFMEDVRSDTSIYTQALKANDLYNTWTPEMPVYLIHSKKDKTISIENSYKAAAYFRENGANVKTDWVEKYSGLVDCSHGYSYLKGYELTKKWIDDLKEKALIRVRSAAGIQGLVRIGFNPIATEWGDNISILFKIGSKVLIECQNDNSTFEGWYEGDKKISGLNPFWINVNGARNIEARFSEGGSSMVHIPKGTFMMGNTRNDSEGYSDEKPVHQVTLTYDYEIGKYEVTNAQFLEFLNDSAVTSSGQLNGHEVIDMYDSDCEIEYSNNRFSLKQTKTGKENYPVIEVTWWGAMEYCNWLSEKDGLSRAYNNDGTLIDYPNNKGYRLPTEAEWEYAARGGENDDNTLTDYKYAGSNNIDKVAWYYGNSNGGTHYVGTKDPNESGIYDMSGNVWEWCSDNCYSYTEDSQTNPYFTTNSSSRVHRGGSLKTSVQRCRIAYRDDWQYQGFDSDYNLGFRIARTRD